jgi:hypothetical protein
MSRSHRKRVIFDLLEAEKIPEPDLQKNFAMTPPAAVSGYIFLILLLYISMSGRLDRISYQIMLQGRKWCVEEASHWLAPNL